MTSPRTKFYAYVQVAVIVILTSLVCAMYPDFRISTKREQNILLSGLGLCAGAEVVIVLNIVISRMKRG